MFRNCIIAFLLATVSTLATTQARAVQRTHVSAAIGVDTNTATGCTPIAPCRTFQAAMTATDSNGEVVVLDSGGYGAVTVTQSVALIAPKGVYAGISVFEGFNGVTIATPGINVVLRGVSINGQGGDHGVFMIAGNKLTVENCVISNLGQTGIFVRDSAVVRVLDTIIRDNGRNGVELQDVERGTITRATISGNSSVGIAINGERTGGLTTADVADSTLSGNSEGVRANSISGAVVKVSVRDSRAVRNSQHGLVALDANLTASNNIISNNGGNGIVSFRALTKVWASGNTVSGNDFGFASFSGSVFQSAGDNAVRNNRNDFSSGIETVGTK